MIDYKLLLSSGHSSYEMRHQTYQLLKIKHEYAKRMLYYQLPIMINSTTNLILDKTFAHTIREYSLYIKNTFVNNYKEMYSLTVTYARNKMFIILSSTTIHYLSLHFTVLSFRYYTLRLTK